MYNNISQARDTVCKYVLIYDTNYIPLYKIMYFN